MLLEATINISGDTGVEVAFVILNNINKPIGAIHGTIIAFMNKITIPFCDLTFSFSRSGGAGGQNVNKVNSKVQMEWNLEQSPHLTSEMKLRFRQRYPGLINQEGVVQIVSQKSRSQKENMDDCIHKLHEMIETIITPPRMRRKTSPTRSSILKRLEGKKKDSEKKRLRKKHL
jgi:ribosome-associated protein